MDSRRNTLRGKSKGVEMIIFKDLLTNETVELNNEDVDIILWSDESIVIFDIEGGDI